MINRAVRYLPILKLLQAESLPRQSILEVGSGPQGMGEYYPRCFVGCDVTFEARPKHPMVPVVASALQLPFENSSFDAVIASDVLEHVPPQQRRDLVRETLRVARKIVLIVSASGVPSSSCNRLDSIASSPSTLSSKKIWRNCVISIAIVLTPRLF